MKTTNYYLKQIDGTPFIICQGDEPKKQDYIVGDNNALISESYFIDLRKWESEKIKYPCHPSQVGAFIKLVSKEGQHLSEFYEDLAEGILIPNDRVKIDNGFAFLIDEETRQDMIDYIASIWGFAKTSDYEHFKKDMIENFEIKRIKK